MAQLATEADTENFLQQLLSDIENNRLNLPTLPEVAIKVREVVEDPEVSATAVSKIISTDTALTARLLQVANSPLMRGNAQVENVQHAVTRLGNVMVRNLVTTLVMEQLYQASSLSMVKKYLKELWVHSTTVAAMSNVIARKFTKLKPDEAMLAGLIHDIGSLPVVMRAETVPHIIGDPQSLQQVIAALHTRVGNEILSQWHFPVELIKVAADHEDLTRDESESPDLVDVVMVANLHSHIGSQHYHADTNWENIPAFKKLGLSPDDSIKAMEEAREEVLAVQGLLNG